MVGKVVAYVASYHKCLQSGHVTQHSMKSGTPHRELRFIGNTSVVLRIHSCHVDNNEILWMLRFGQKAVQ